MQTLYQTFTRSVIVKYRDLSIFSPLKLSNFGIIQCKKIKKCSKNYNEFERTVFKRTGRLSMLPVCLAFNYLCRHVIICTKCHCSDGPFPSQQRMEVTLNFHQLRRALLCLSSCLPAIKEQLLMSSFGGRKMLNDVHLEAT